MSENKQKLYILDSNGLPIGYVFMRGNVLYSIDGRAIKEVPNEATIGELKAALLKEITWYIK
ncbi:hypothetical protein MUP77_00170 [Candidatus Bathyarchaeota archaeon]|nr:hypothetical protein [Candidatus Bathyarchaeota archaeon]